LITVVYAYRRTCLHCLFRFVYSDGLIISPYIPQAQPAKFSSQDESKLEVYVVAIISFAKPYFVVYNAQVGYLPVLVVKLTATVLAHGRPLLARGCVQCSQAYKGRIRSSKYYGHNCTTIVQTVHISILSEGSLLLASNQDSVTT
jgi:hypothetical protein